MKKLGTVSICASLCAGAFVAGLAVGAPKKAPTFMAFGDLTFKDVGGPKLADLWGDHEKGAFGGLLQIPAGFTAPMHTHNADYQGIEIKGTSSHWVVGEDGTQAKKMVAGSYWTVPAKLPHVSACAAGEDCVMLIISKGKFSFNEVGNDGKPLPKAATPKPPTGTAPPKTTK